MRSLLVLVMLTAPALADPKTKSPEAMHTDDCARARAQNKKCVLDIEGTTVNGATPGGGGTTVVAPPTAKEPSMIRLRKDFIVEIIRSAEDL